MLPAFPKFKPLELSDVQDVQRYTSPYAPFSDFNFAGLWAWNVDNSVRLSELDGNLVIRFADYVTGAVFYSLLGDRDVNSAVKALIDLSHQENIQPKLRLVPEVVASQLDQRLFAVMEEEQHADYILMVDRLCTYQGSQLATKRNEVRKFVRLFPNVRFEVLDLGDASIADQCLALFQRWNVRRAASGDREAEREYKAFERILASHGQLSLIGAGIFINDMLVAASISEIIDNKYAFTHFEKAETASFSGITSYLNQQVANLLAGRGIQYLNIEEDLGIAGLRTNKRSYHPCGYLRKFSVSYRESVAA